MSPLCDDLDVDDPLLHMCKLYSSNSDFESLDRPRQIVVNGRTPLQIIFLDVRAIRASCLRTVQTWCRLYCKLQWINRLRQNRCHHIRCGISRSNMHALGRTFGCMLTSPERASQTHENECSMLPRLARESKPGHTTTTSHMHHPLPPSAASLDRANQAHGPCGSNADGCYERTARYIFSSSHAM